MKNRHEKIVNLAQTSTSIDELIENINNNQNITWQANECMLSKNNSKYKADICEK